LIILVLLDNSGAMCSLRSTCFACSGLFGIHQFY
jgi:hypothetical protein